MKDFKGKVAVITGAGRGMGRGIAFHCARKGMKIVLADIRLESLTSAEAGLQALGAETLLVQTDVSLLADVENLAKKSYERFEAVDLLVNNDGVSTASSVLASPLDDCFFANMGFPLRKLSVFCLKGWHKRSSISAPENSRNNPPKY